MSDQGLRRPERLAALAMLLARRPAARHNLEYFVELTGVSRSTLSSDLGQLDDIAQRLGTGRVETSQGQHGGVRYLLDQPPQATRGVLERLVKVLSVPARVLPGGYLYLTDLVCSPEWSSQLGAIFAQAMRATEPTHVLTVETRGIPIALMTAYSLGLPLLVARRNAQVAEGPALSISYLSATSGRVENMSLPRRAMRAGAQVLIVDDFMRGGATAKGLIDLANEFEADVVGVGVAIATAQPVKKRVARYLPLLTLNRVDEASRWVDISANSELASGQSRG